MTTYLARKLMMLPLMLLGASMIVFFAIRLLPGDPARLVAGPQAPGSVVESIRVRMGLDRPLLVQYGSFLMGVARGDLGDSIRSLNPVTEELGKAFPYTARLVLLSYSFAVVFGVTAGIAAAIRRGSWLDTLVMLLAIVGASTANFWLALMAMDVFSVQLGWLPLLGAGTWRHYVLPAFALGFFPTALVARMTRSSMLEVINQDYVRTARAKGLHEGVITRKHALRNALIPITTVVGLNVGVLLGGAVVTETVFNWPGMGRMLVDAVRFRDYAIIQGVTLLTVLTVVLTNFFVDVIIAAIDPRIRFD